METINDRLRVENTFLRHLLTRLATLTPPGTPAASLLERSRPSFDRSTPPPEPPLVAFEDPEDPEDLDPIAHALHAHPRASLLDRQRQAVLSTLRAHLPESRFRDVLRYEELSEERTAVLEDLVFAHGFRLGQLWPQLPDDAPAPHHRALRRLVRAAADRRSPPRHRLRVLLNAALQALDDSSLRGSSRDATSPA